MPNATKNNSNNKTHKPNGKRSSTNRGRSYGHSNQKTEFVKQDWSWYAQNPEALKNIASLPFPEAIGESTDLTRHTDYNMVHCVPGIIQHRFIPTIGLQPLDINNTANRAARAYFNELTKGFTGTMPFEPSDMLFTAYASAGLYMMVMEAKRAYGLIQKFHLYNKYLAREVVEACGFDYDSLVANKADFRARLNIYIDQLNSLLLVPKGFKIIERWAELVSNVFVDDPNISKQQFNIAVPAGYPCWSGTATPTQGTAIVFQRRADTVTVDEFFAQMDLMMNQLQSEDARQIFGALNRVYTPEVLYKLTYLEDNFVINWAHSDIWLSQFHNNTRFENGEAGAYSVKFGWYNGASYETSELLAFQHNGIIASIPLSPASDYSTDFMFIQDQFILDTIISNATPDVIIDVTAGQAVPTNFIIAGRAAISCRSEIWLCAKVFTLDVDSGSANRISLRYAYNRAEAYFAAQSMSTSFNYAPYYFVTSGEDLASTTHVYTVGELANYTYVNKQVLMNMHDRCMFTMLSLPKANESVTK